MYNARVQPDGVGSAIGTRNEETRHKWVREALARLPAGARILDAGAGTQPYRAHCAHLVYVAHDFAAYDGAGDGVGLQTGEFQYGKLDYVSDITAIPAADGTFDAVLCTEVLEHVARPEAALRELVRLLKPSGDLLLTAPFVSFTHFAPYHFCTGFNVYYFSHHLSELQMKILEMTPNGDFFELVAQEVRRTSDVAARYGRARLTLLERVARKIFLRGLARLQRAGGASSEFACAGLHVHARKLG